jgi:hypothetical protein
MRPDAGFTPLVSTCDFVMTGEAVVRVQLPKCFARNCNDARSVTVFDPASGGIEKPLDMRIEIQNALSGKFTSLFPKFIGDGHRELGLWCGVGSPFGERL